MPWPMVAAICVARGQDMREASAARSTRPPSMGKAGIMLNTTREDVHSRRGGRRKLTRGSSICAMSAN